MGNLSDFNTNKISSRLFFYDPQSRCFSAEASSLPEDFDPLEVRQWQDSCDVGFEMVGEKTGKKILFLFVKRNMNSEGETLFWEFVADPAYNKDVITDTVYLNIFND